MSTTISYVIGLAIAIACSIGCWKIASGKGRSPLGYAILGFVLPLIGLIVVAVVPRKQRF